MSNDRLTGLDRAYVGTWIPEERRRGLPHCGFVESLIEGFINVGKVKSCKIRVTSALIIWESIKTLPPWSHSS
jgi:hypothetical protein